MSCTYILYSEKADKYYVGSTTETADVRLNRHNTDYYEGKYTADGKPWRLFFTIPCETIEQARKIEKHIKAMKSRKYIENLLRYPEITERLLLKYQ